MYKKHIVRHNYTIFYEFCGGKDNLTKGVNMPQALSCQLSTFPRFWYHKGIAVNADLNVISRMLFILKTTSELSTFPT